MNYEKWEKVFFFSFLAIFMSGEVDIITLKCFTSGAVYCSLAELENDLQNCRQCWTMCGSIAAVMRHCPELTLKSN